MDLDSPPKYTYSTRLTSRYTRFESPLALGPSRYICFRSIDFYITPNIPLIEQILRTSRSGYICILLNSLVVANPRGSMRVVINPRLGTLNSPRLSSSPRSLI